jgi:hypothetical protein
MAVDFFQDDNGKIWLYYARKIVYREPRENKLLPTLNLK